MRLLATTITLIATLASTGCSKTPEQQFWDWFTPKAENYAQIYSWDQISSETGDPNKRPSGIAMKEISIELKKINPAFSPFLGGQGDGKRNFIVTVYGQSDLFDEVDQFVNNAPESEHWNFIALKPGKSVSPGTLIQTGDITIALGDARFTFQQTGDGLADLVVYLHPEVDSDTPRAEGLARSLSVDIVGERLAGTTLGEIEVKSLTKAPDDALPFLEMASHLEKLP